MIETLKYIVKEVTPPICLRGAKLLLRLNEGVGEKNPEYYDKSFEAIDYLHNHYTESHCYLVWAVIADRITRAVVDSILDIGCGPGQVASLLRDKGIRQYHGIDFSPKRIEWAKKACPEFTFTVEDAYKTSIFATLDYHAVIATEFLEHVEGDVEIISRIKSGAKFYGSVPNFPNIAHVRYFQDEKEVYSRYEQYFKDFRVDSLLGNARGKTFYLLEGIRK